MYFQIFSYCIYPEKSNRATCKLRQKNMGQRLLNVYYIMTRVALTEKEKLAILFEFKTGNTSARKIAAIIGKPKCTVDNFIKSYLKHGTINPKRGRPAIVKLETRNQIAAEVQNNPFLPIRDQTPNHPISRETIRKIRHDEGYNFYELTPTCNLTEEHIKKRLQYCNDMHFFVHWNFFNTMN